LHLLLKEYGMLAKKKAGKVATTASNHPHYKYPTCAKDLKPTRITELWPGRRSDENAMAERVLRSLKDDCKLARGFSSFPSAEEAVERAINAYNTVRPHASLNYFTATADRPQQMHQRKRKPKLRWYPYKKVRYGNVQYKAAFR
jgi:transposase InsO family protein